MEKLSFVIPCYGSEQTITGVVREIIQWMQAHPDYCHEIILVNDCSPDGVYPVLLELTRSLPEVTVIELARNGGKHAAMMAGYQYVTGDIVVNLDDDGQCPLDKLDLLLNTLYADNDVVFARYPQKKQSPFKNFGSKVNEWMAQWLINQPKGLQISNFSVMRRIILQEVLRYKNPYPYLSGLILRSTVHIANVEMEERKRFAGQSGYGFHKSVSLWLNGFTAFSVKPLRLASIIGFICAVAGFAVGIYTIIHKLAYPMTPAGYSSVMAVLLFVGGMLMIMLGLIGEYIGRIYISINNSPQYVIRSVISGQDEKTTAS